MFTVITKRLAVAFARVHTYDLWPHTLYGLTFGIYESHWMKDKINRCERMKSKNLGDWKPKINSYHVRLSVHRLLTCVQCSVPLRNDSVIFWHNHNKYALNRFFFFFQLLSVKYFFFLECHDELTFFVNNWTHWTATYYVQNEIQLEWK